MRIQCVTEETGFWDFNLSGGERASAGAGFRSVTRYQTGEPPSHLFAERYSDLVSSLGCVLDDQVVERSKAGGNLVAALLGRGCCAAVVRLRH